MARLRIPIFAENAVIVGVNCPIEMVEHGRQNHDFQFLDLAAANRDDLRKRAPTAFAGSAAYLKLITENGQLKDTCHEIRLEHAALDDRCERIAFAAAG
ncbi:MAG: hypothetical protein JSS02_05600 [Planctomycetes bacterium]|nr:hypothetical protein [Planctomycetota bacterium]